MAIIINGTLNIDGTNKTNIKKEQPLAPIIQSFSFSVSTDGQACGGAINLVIIYSASSILGIGSTIYQDSQLTTPTTYVAISNPANEGNDYFIVVGNTLTSNATCN